MGEKYMDNRDVAEKYCQMGEAHFEQGEYESALQCFILAYEFGENREQLLKVIYDCYVTPNEEEFRYSYEKNKAFFCDLEYEELRLDFVPATDEKFFVFDKQAKAFLGVFEMPDVSEHREVVLQSLLLSEVWDFREYQGVFFKEDWSAVYFVVGDNAPLFYSFFKIPNFVERYFDKVICFKNREELEDFFLIYPQFYLPCVVFGKNYELYTGILKEIHEKRLQQEIRERENVFLSICIPSYNRGKLAYNLIDELLQMPWDAEIEIILSDNGSDKETEYYEKIASMKDVRLRYHRFQENQGFTENFHKLLHMANGKFSVFISDEDHFMDGVIYKLMNTLAQNAEVGMVYLPTEKLFRVNRWWYQEAGIMAVLMGKESRYLSGLVFNNIGLKLTEAEEWVKKHTDNQAYKWYPHTVYAMYIGAHMDAMRTEYPGIVEGTIGATPDEVKSEGVEMENEEKHILRYMWPEERIGQMKAFLELMTDILNNYLGYTDQSRQGMALGNVIDDAYWLSALAYKKNPAEFCEKHSWKETCKMIRDAAAVLFVNTRLQAVMELVGRELYEKWEVEFDDNGFKVQKGESQ